MKFRASQGMCRACREAPGEKNARTKSKSAAPEGTGTNPSSNYPILQLAAWQSAGHGSLRHAAGYPVMADPITLDIPHKLGLEPAKARIGGGVGKIADMFPGGGHVEQHWEGDVLHFTVNAMGQKVASRLEVHADKVHAVVDLPPMLALFAGKIREKLAREAPKLLQ